MEKFTACKMFPSTFALSQNALSGSLKKNHIPINKIGATVRSITQVHANNRQALASCTTSLFYVNSSKNASLQCLTEGLSRLADAKVGTFFKPTK